jgi:hypothetical protein
MCSGLMNPGTSIDGEIAAERGVINEKIAPIWVVDSTAHRDLPSDL